MSGDPWSKFTSLGPTWEMAHDWEEAGKRFTARSLPAISMDLGFAKKGGKPGFADLVCDWIRRLHPRR